MKEIYIIAGPNGAGKTTAAYDLLPHFLNTNEYVNADSIAHALSPFNADKVALQAGKIMLKRIDEFVIQNRNFAFETTLARKNYVRLLTDCKNAGYQTNLIFLWLHDAKLAIQRVKLRVAQGGHSIPIDTIARRYTRGMKNLFKLYMPVVDNWWLYDNSDAAPKIISKQLISKSIEIIDVKRWQLLLDEYRGGI